MNIIFIISVAVIGVILSLTVKKINPEYSTIIGLVCGCIIILYLISGFDDIFSFTDKFIKMAGVSDENFKILLKALGIGYIVQFGCDLCRDAGENSIANKIEIAGKVCILLMSLPLVENLFGLVEKITGI